MHPSKAQDLASLRRLRVEAASEAEATEIAVR
jgi:hypothetical protein